MNKDRLGFYRVGWKKFYNKTLALIENHRTGYEIEWIFNDDIYKNIDWTVTILDSLENLYRKRAQQLRDRYDYLVLYFSGGADSTNILLTFLKNNIFLDEIVMQIPESAVPTFNEEDKSNRNIYSEIKYQAVPTLTNLNLHPNTKIRYQDFSKPFLETMKNDDWFEKIPMGTNISPSGVARQVAQVKEPHILELCNKGKRAAQILGVDKPLVHSDGVEYWAYFSDVSAMHSPPVDFTESDIFHNLYHTEFFYWTPDLPEIVVKQAQLIKQHCQISDESRKMIMLSMKKHISTYRPLLHDIIYPKDVKVLWDPEKPDSKILRPMDDWFWKTADDRQKNNYLSVIEYIRHNTKSIHMINDNIENGIAAHQVGFYKL